MGSTGSVLRDMSGRGKHGTLTNMDPASDWVVSGGKYALDFDGSNDAVSMPLKLSHTAQATVSAWLYWNAYANNDHALCELTPNFNMPENRGWFISPNSSTTKFECMMSSGGGPYNGGYFSRPSAAVWHHYLFIMDRTTGTALGVSVWVDGVQVTVTQSQFGNITTNFADGTLFLMSRNAASLFGAGQIDDLLIYDRRITPAEIKILATRRGIAYEAAPRRNYKSAAAGFRPAWASQRSQLIGGGIR